MLKYKLVKQHISTNKNYKNYKNYQKYLKYKTKYLSLKGGNDNIVTFDKPNLPSTITDIFNFDEYNIEDFLNLDITEYYDRRVVFIFDSDNETFISFPLYMTKYSIELNEDNDNIFYECKGITNNIAIQIRENNIIDIPLVKIAGLITFYINLTDLITIKQSTHKYWFFDDKKVIHRIVSRKIVLTSDRSLDGIDRTLNNVTVNETSTSTLVQSSTRCIHSDYDVYNVKKLVVLTPNVTQVLSVDEISILARELFYQTNLDLTAIHVYIDDFFKIYPEEKYYDDDKLLIDKVYLYIMKHLKPKNNGELEYNILIDRSIINVNEHNDALEYNNLI